MIIKESERIIGKIEYKLNCFHSETDLRSIYDLQSETMRGCRLAWSRLRDLGAMGGYPLQAKTSRDPGSNPGSPTNSNLIKQLSGIDVLDNLKLTTSLKQIVQKVQRLLHLWTGKMRILSPSFLRL